jgi:polyhydroxyalkanoate synthase
VLREVRRRMDRFLTGLERYRHHPYRRTLADPPAVWREGATRLLDYGAVPGAATAAEAGADVGAEAGALPVLVVPSLVNRGYVLDLAEGNSLLRWLAGAATGSQAGTPPPARPVRPLLVDWGWPDAAARGFDLTDYVAGRLERALDAALALAGGRPVPVVGSCMGGLLAVALAQRRARDVAGLALLATPWDFHADGPDRARGLAATMAPWQPAIALWGELPVDGVQALFALLDPLGALKKFTGFAAVDPDSARARAFVALEDWLNDGVPLAGRVARECLDGWYGANTPATGRWTIAGAPVDPAALACPSLHLIPAADRIVPPASAAALAAAMPGAEVVRPPLGHIGMVVGSRAPTAVWPTLAAWLAGLN